MKKIKATDYLFISAEELGQKEIYHYTNADALYKIINNKTLRLTSSKYLNDTKELKILQEIINPEMLDEESIPYDIKRIDEINQLLKENENEESFILSFSKHRDLLSQWRGYADNSKGLSIGFDVNKLKEKLIKLIPISTKIKELFCFIMQPVIYDKTEQCKKFRINEFRENEKKTISILSTNIGINSWACLLKSEGFKEEDEIRIVYTPKISATDEHLTINGPLTKLNHFHNNGLLKPFFEIDFSDCPEVISSITIGANCRITKWELKRFLLSNNIPVKNIEILKSDLSYII